LQKIVTIFLVLFYLTGCSVSKPLIQNNTIKKSINGSNVELNELVGQNITANSFLIQKAEVDVSEQGEKQRFIASVKFNKPDSFLISVRSTTGIEAVRIFTTKDTILINDRINRTFFYGNRKAAEKKYGVSSVLFPVLLGDVVVSDKSETTFYKCENDLITLSSFVEGIRLDYLISCENLRTAEISLTREISSKPVVLKFNDFGKVSDFIFAERVGITDFNNIDFINVRFSKIEVPWDGNMVFVPGSNYERIEIK